MKIEVTNNVTEPRAAGQGMVRDQEIWVECVGQRYPQRSKLSLWDKDAALAEGMYEFDADSAVYVGQYDRLYLSMRPEHFKPIGGVKAVKSS